MEEYILSSSISNEDPLTGHYFSTQRNGCIFDTTPTPSRLESVSFPPSHCLEFSLSSENGVHSVQCVEQAPDSTLFSGLRTRAVQQLKQKAQSKQWLDEVRSGELPQITLPGLTQGGGIFTKDRNEVSSFNTTPVEFEPFTTDPLSLKANQVEKGEDWSIRGGQPNLEVEFEKLRNSLAKEFPFELDQFQKEAICNLEMGRSVFVAAHTSAGKTVVAEYAFALATSHCTRAVYTSPIKTISNQKFKDFSSQFDVGIMTGDTQINPHASCLILTTEILRSMLYKGADVTRDMEFVIFDEVHYVNDAERGVVWEETIIMLPAHVQVILLSATVPNVDEFAAWVGRTRKTKIYVSGTNKRPVPLQHNLYYQGKLHKVCDGDQFLPDGYLAAKTALKSKTPGLRPPNQTKRDSKRTPSTKSQDSMLHFLNKDSGPNSASSSQSRSQQTQLKNLLIALQKKGLLPTVVFVFSKKLCDESAILLGSLDLSSSTEAHETHNFIERSLSRLAEQDRIVPQILQMQDWLKRGIGVHHAGLLPIMKEIVEMLFCKGLLKVLFATETFAMGVNAPAKTVIFQSLKKHDGNQFRVLLPGEYTQMAGRAGRRGIDEVGTVVVACWEELPDETVLRSLIRGRGVVLSSRFRLTYSMMMNLMRVDDLKVEDMLKRSFAEFHAQKSIGGYIEQIERLDLALKELRDKDWPECSKSCTRSQVEDYCKSITSLKDLNHQMISMILDNVKVQKSLVNGRVILVQDKESGLLELGVLLLPVVSKGKKQSSPLKMRVISLHVHGPWDVELADRTLDRAIRELKGLDLQGRKPMKSKWDLGSEEGDEMDQIQLPICDKRSPYNFKIAEIESEQLIHILADRLHVSWSKLLSQTSTSPDPVYKILEELDQIRKTGMNFMDMKISNNVDLLGPLNDRQELIEKITKHPVNESSSLPQKFSRIHNEQEIEKNLKELRHRISDAALKQMPEYEQRLKVLEHFGYVDETGTVQLKGRVACEINSGDELVITEMIFHGVLNPLTPQESVAVLSAFVFQEKNQEIGNLNEALEKACRQLRELCMECGIFQFDCGLGLDPDSFCNTIINFGLVEVVYEWAKGTPFVEICNLTKVPEGTIVRTIVRLEQSCREIMDAARVMGNTALFNQMQQASALIKRDVIFAPSLYVTL